MAKSPVRTFQVGELSPNHLAAEDAERIASDGAAATGGLRVAKDGGQFFIRVPRRFTDEIQARCPDSLMTCLTWATDLGLDYLLFDTDADRVEGLPLYEW